MGLLPMGFLTFEIGIQIPRETGAVPPHGGLGCDNKECRLPTGPAPANEQREGPVGQIRPRTWMTAFQRRKLLAVRPDSQAVDVLRAEEPNGVLYDDSRSSSILGQSQSGHSWPPLPRQELTTRQSAVRSNPEIKKVHTLRGNPTTTRPRKESFRNE